MFKSIYLLLSCSFLLAGACSNNNITELDAGSMQKSDAGLMQNSDAGHINDAGQQNHNLDCGDSCPEMTLHTEFEGHNVSFNSAVFGLTSGTRSTSGEWELFIEVYNGDQNLNCETRETLRLDHILTLAGIKIHNQDSDFPLNQDFTALFLDLKKDILLGNTPLAGSNDVKISTMDIRLCDACTIDQNWQIDQVGILPWIALDIDVTYSEEQLKGHIKGQIFAEYCPELNAE